MEKAAAVRIVQLTDDVQLAIPVGSMDKPSERSEHIMRLHEHPHNWKLPILEYRTTDKSEAEDYGYCLNWYCGGHEIETIYAASETIYVVSSKGYYHYVGA